MVPVSVLMQTKLFQELYFIEVLAPFRGEKKSVPHPEIKILVDVMDSFQNFR